MQRPVDEESLYGSRFDVSLQWSGHFGESILAQPGVVLQEEVISRTGGCSQRLPSRHEAG